MKALFIANGIPLSNGSVSVSGGDFRWMTIAKIWQSKGVDIHVLTQEAGMNLCERFGLEAIFHDSRFSSGEGRAAYIDRGAHSFFLPDELHDYDGLIYSTTELMYDVIPGARVRKWNQSSRLGVVAHHVPPFRRKNTTLINSALFYLNNRIGIRYARTYADIVFGVSAPTIRDLENKTDIPASKLREVACGVDLASIDTLPVSTEKKYDAVFMKRLDIIKVVFDMLSIWAEVVSRRPGSKLLIIGYGSDATMERIRRFIDQNGLQDNIDIHGPVYDVAKKYELLSSSRLFLLPTNEENWAIVIGEAMAAGLPVVCYDLPEIRPVWEDSIIWVPKGDRTAFADVTLRLLEDENARSDLSSGGRSYVRRYDWQPIAMGELEALKALLPGQEMGLASLR